MRSRWWLPVAGAALLLAGSVVLWRDAGLGAAPVAADRQPRTAAAAPLRAAPEPTAAAGRDVARDPRDPQRARRRAAPGTPAPDEAVVRGRCIADESGQPLPDCEVFLILHTQASLAASSPYGPAASRVHRHRDRGGPGTEHEFVPVGPPLEDIALDRHFLSAAQLAGLRDDGAEYARRPNAVSDAAGRFEIRFHPGGDRVLGWQLQIASAMRCPRDTGFFGFEVEAGARRNFGDIRLRPGVRVQGRLRDEVGTPIAGATVFLEGVPMQLPEGHDKVWTESRRGGRFAFREPIPPGRYGIAVRVAGAELLAPTHVDIGGAVDLEVVMRREATITGAATDRAGQPANGVVLLAVGDDRVVYGRGITDEQGRFCIRPEQRSSPPVRLVTRHEFTEFDGRREPVGWGTTDLRLTLRATRPLTLHVVDAVTGEPLADANLIVWLTPLGPATCDDLETVHHFFWRQQRHDGHPVVPHARSGRHRVRVKLNASDHFVPATVVDDLEPDGPRAWTVALQPAVPLAVEVSDHEGVPLAAARIAMARSGAWTTFPAWYGDDGFLTHAETDREGHAVLVGAAVGMTVDVRVHHPGYTPQVRRGVAVAAPHGPPLRIRLAAEGR